MRSTRGRQLVGHSALYGLAGGLGKALALLTVPILSRLLTPSEYGLADLANTLAAMLAMVAMFAGDIPAARLAALAHRPEERRAILSSYVWATVVTGTLIGLALLPFARTIAEDVWSSPGSDGIVFLVILLIPIGAVQASLITTHRIDGRPVPFAILATIDLLSQMVLAVLFVALGWGAFGMVAGIVAGSFIGLLAVAIDRRSLILAAPRLRISQALVTEGLAFLPAALGFVVAGYTVRFLLADSQGPDSVGQFGVATRLAGGMALATAAFSMAWGPFGLALPDSPETARLFGRVLRRYAVLTVLGSLALGAVAPELVTLVSGREYVTAGTMLPGLLVAAAMAGGFYLLLVAAGISQRGRAVALAAVVGALVQVVATAALLPALGLQAVGVGAIVGQALALVMLVIAVRSSVYGAGGPVVLLCLGGVIGAMLQALNANPEGSLPLRLLIAAIAALLAIRTLLGALRGPLGGKQQK